MFLTLVRVQGPSEEPDDPFPLLPHHISCSQFQLVVSSTCSKVLAIRLEATWKAQGIMPQDSCLADSC